MHVLFDQLDELLGKEHPASSPVYDGPLSTDAAINLAALSLASQRWSSAGPAGASAPHLAFAPGEEPGELRVELSERAVLAFRAQASAQAGRGSQAPVVASVVQRGGAGAQTPHVEAAAPRVRVKQVPAQAVLMQDDDVGAAPVVGCLGGGWGLCRGPR